MKLKNVLITVEDIDRSVAFYKELFGLRVLVDNDGHIIMTEGLVLQQRDIWAGFLEREVTPKSNCTELYFEESDIEGFVQKLEASGLEFEYVNRLMTHYWGQTVVRFYDPDGNLIEVGTPMY